jgi:predicted O-methyltransferase YrrM
MNYPSKEFIEEFKKVPGALSVTESISIYNIALEAPQGLYIELGSHKGKSGMSAALGLKEGLFYLVDPIFEDTNLAREVSERVRSVGKPNIVMVNGYSTDFIENHNNISYAFIDSGSHGDGLPMQEVKMLEDRMVTGGIICFHDYLSQFVEVHQAYDYLVSTGKYEPININWNEIIDYVGARNLEKDNSSWHHTEMEFPNFVGAVRRK